MGDLRPLGSEKLEGVDKLKRIMEIARYNEAGKILLIPLWGKPLLEMILMCPVRQEMVL